MIMLEVIAINVMGERERALNWIRMEFIDINVTRERESWLKSDKDGFLWL